MCLPSIADAWMETYMRKRVNKTIVYIHWIRDNILLVIMNMMGHAVLCAFFMISVSFNVVVVSSKNISFVSIGDWGGM